MSASTRPYLSNGQVLPGPPLSARFRSFVDGTYDFLGLYVASLFSFDAYAAAEASSFNIRNRSPGMRGSARYRGGGGGGGSGGGGSGYGGGGGKKLGRVDDVRGPECKSCG